MQTRDTLRAEPQGATGHPRAVRGHNRRHILAVALVTTLAISLPSHASLAYDAPTAQSPHAAPTTDPTPVAYPGPGETLVPVPGTERLRSPEDRVAAIFAHWRDGDTAPVVPFHGLEIRGEGAHVLLELDALRNLHDHDIELILLAVFAALHDSAPAVRTVFLDGVSAAGERVPEHAWRPRLAPTSTRPDPPAPPSGNESGIRPFRQQEGALSGRRIALSPGHGWTWLGDRWATQRSDSFGLIEDFLTATICREHVDPYLVAAGADVVWVRERSDETLPGNIVDDGDARYGETGDGFSQGAGAGGWAGDYRFVAAGQLGAIASWQTPISAERVPVFAWWVPGNNRNAQALYRVHHRGGTAEVRRNQQLGGPHWQYLGTWALDADSFVELATEAGAEGVNILDAIHFGTATGGIRRNGAPSGHPAWQENARNYAEYSGAPASVYAARANERDSDIVARPLWANRLAVDAFVSVHTNAAGGTGTETFIMNTNPTAGSAALRRAIQQQLVGDIRAWWNADWVDRGEKSANFGELRELTNAPGALVEIAFHDRNPATGPDVPSLHDPRFRRIAGRAIARAVVRYFDANAPFVPEPPLDVRAVNTPDGIEVRFDDTGAREGAGPATSWRVFLAFDDRPFDDGHVVHDGTFLIDTLQPGDVVHVRVAGRNAGGTGLPSRTVSARRGHGGLADALLVNAYRRWDRSTGELGNTGDAIRRWAEALPLADPDGSLLAFDGATREAFAQGRVSPGDTILWQAGRDEGEVPPLSPAEADRLASHLDNGGAVLLSGAFIASHLAGPLSTHPLQASADAQVGEPRDTPTLASGAAIAQNTSRLHYAVPQVDSIQLSRPATGTLTWTDGSTAAWWRTNERVALASLPIESLVDTAQRSAFLGQLLDGIGAAGQTPPPTSDTPPTDEPPPPSESGSAPPGSLPPSSTPPDGTSAPEPSVPPSNSGEPATSGGTASGSAPDASDGSAQGSGSAPSNPADPTRPGSDSGASGISESDGTTETDRSGTDSPVPSNPDTTGSVPDLERPHDGSALGPRALPGEGNIEISGCRAARGSGGGGTVLVLLFALGLRRSGNPQRP